MTVEAIHLIAGRRLTPWCLLWHAPIYQLFSSKVPAFPIILHKLVTKPLTRVSLGLPFQAITLPRYSVSECSTVAKVAEPHLIQLTFGTVSREIVYVKLGHF